MGYELWTSPVTGYRRKGTRLAELRALIDSGMTARAILEPLQSCASGADAIVIAEVLRKREFDIAGVKRAEDGPVIGWVSNAALTSGQIENHIRPLTSSCLVSDATPLPAVLNVFLDREFTFVLVGADVAGIITRADLNKPPVRVYLFTLISLLEMHLSFWVRAKYPGDSWQGKLNPARLVAARKIQELRRSRNQDPILVECLQFCDKRKLIVTNVALLTELGLVSESEGNELLRRAEELRNMLAHSQHDLVEGSSWVALIGVVGQIEKLVHTSDQRVEELVSTSSTGQDDGLWASA